MMVACLSSTELCVFVDSFSDIAMMSFTARVLGNQRSSLQMSATPFNYGQRQRAHTDVRLPLLVDLCADNSQLRYDVPLPNMHLPPELTTTSLVELEVAVPLHCMMIEDAVSSAREDLQFSCCYGHVVHSPHDEVSDLVGSIGCAGEILISTPSAMEAKGADLAEAETPLSVLARGSFRFRVKKIVKSIPYPVAIVDEILDDNIRDKSTENHVEEEGDIYDTLPPKDLIREIFQCLEFILKRQVDRAATPLSPLEQQILENAPSSAPLKRAQQQQLYAEESVAVFHAFKSSLLDIAPEERDKRYAVAMMAGELGNLPPKVRVEMLAMTDGEARLRLVLRELSSILAMESARTITKTLSLDLKKGEDGSGINKMDVDGLREVEEARKELNVGNPQLPPWASQIKQGVRVEYFWNEDEGWCAGTVVAEPLRIVDEIIVTVSFDDDGSVHKLPLRGDDKARWRPPPRGGSFD